MNLSSDTSIQPSDLVLRICSVFHPQARRPDQVEYLDASMPACSPESTKTHPPVQTLEERLINITGEPPWAPFRCRPDFEFHELLENAGIKGRERMKWLQGVGNTSRTSRRIINDPTYVYPYKWFDTSKVTYTSEDDMDYIMELACKRMLGVSYGS
jgi:hypothetical protein